MNTGRTKHLRGARLVALLLPAACACVAPRPADPPAASAFAIAGATVPAPAGPAWVVAESGATAVAFERAGPGAMTRLRASSLSAPRNAAPTTATRFMEADREGRIDTTTFEILTIHFNHNETRGMPCVQHDFILRDRAPRPGAFDHHYVYGVTCYSSPRAGRAIEMEVTHHSHARDTPEDVRTTIERFIDSVRLAADE